MLKKVKISNEVHHVYSRSAFSFDEYFRFHHIYYASTHKYIRIHS